MPSTVHRRPSRVVATRPHLLEQPLHSDAPWVFAPAASARSACHAATEQVSTAASAAVAAVPFRKVRLVGLQRIKASFSCMSAFSLSLKPFGVLPKALGKIVNRPGQGARQFAAVGQGSRQLIVVPRHGQRARPGSQVGLPGPPRKR